jgi:hypothetical protein
MRILQVLKESSSRTVTVRRTLNPLLWKGEDLKPEVRSHLIKIANKFEEFVGLELDVIDITVTGSNANYMWTKHSDLDLHLIVPGVPDESERELFTAKKALWAEQHDITIKGIPVECYVQGEGEPHHSTGVYSVQNGSWIDSPEKVKPRVDDGAVQTKTDDLVRIANKAILKRDRELLELVKEKITKMRKAGLERAGEWSTENLVFKNLRNLGIIDQLTTLIRELEDEELSLENRLS